MKMNLLFRLFLLVATLGFGTAAVRAQNEEAIKARMAQRLSAVDALKDRQVAGENNRGLLEARGQLTGPDQQIISEENSDRQAVYTALAAKTGATPDTVGRQRAQQIALRSKRGVWLQDPSGEWRQKP
jgi:uncharacterized protein YdbL (DUF1318 family)